MAQVPQKTKPPQGTRPEVRACRDRITELTGLNHQFDALTLEKLTSIQKEVSDCVYAEGVGLSKVDIIAAYKLRDETGKEGSKRIRDAAKTIADDDQKVRGIGLKIAQSYLEEEKGYKDIIQRYNTLVDSYNGMLREYRATVEQNGRLLDRMQDSLRATRYNCEVSALENLINSAARTTPQPVYKPPAQLHCTTQNMPSPLDGLPSWSYTSCY